MRFFQVIGIFGKKLEDGAVITVHYITTSGKEGNGPSIFAFAGSFTGSTGQVVIPTVVPTVDTVVAASNGGDIESIDSIKYFAPRLYSSQYRAVTSRDYESIVQKIYPNTESISVVGGEELDPPEFGTVQISIKPKKLIKTLNDFGGMKRSLINNAVIGSSKGYEKILELVGVGYRAALKGESA